MGYGREFNFFVHVAFLLFFRSKKLFSKKKLKRKQKTKLKVKTRNKVSL